MGSSSARMGASAFSAASAATASSSSPFLNHIVSRNLPLRFGFGRLPAAALPRGDDCPDAGGGAGCGGAIIVGCICGGRGGGAAGGGGYGAASIVGCCGTGHDCGCAAGAGGGDSGTMTAGGRSGTITAGGRPDARDGGGGGCQVIPIIVFPADGGGIGAGGGAAGGGTNAGGVGAKA